jgi:LacI family transcriptional regulator
VGILTFDDKLGERVLTACHWAELAVPGQVAILGIGNDDLISKLTWPPLSSIDVPAERIGFEAADILRRAMAGMPIEEPRKKIPPTGVTMRGATALLAVEDPLVESAARFIREHAGEVIGIEHVARFLGISRRTLDRRFERALGRSTHEELAAIRMEKARLLLSESQDTVARIAAACGFLTAASFSRSFHRQIGCWPVEYRNLVRGS